MASSLTFACLLPKQRKEGRKEGTRLIGREREKKNTAPGENPPCG
jgi:hypothetical protein